MSSRATPGSKMDHDAFAELLRNAYPGHERPSERHLEILRAALALFAERGYAGATLRELARRVDVQQPSLYHWFESKEQLAEQVIAFLGPELLAGGPLDAIPKRLEDVPRFLVEYVFHIWRDAAYAEFVRFLFVIAVEQPRHRAAIEALYGRGSELGAQVLMSQFVVTGEIEEAEARSFVRLAIDGVALRMVEERLLYGRKSASPELKAHGERVIKLLEDTITLRRSVRGERR